MAIFFKLKKRLLKQMYYFIFKQVLSPTRINKLLEPRCEHNNLKVIISKITENPFVLREIKDSNKLSLVLL